MRKNYNYERKKLILPEYGRHIHEMIDYLSTIKDRDERNIQAHAVIAVMGNLNPLLRDTADYNHKLWDHLFIMAEFDLDVDSPYPIPTEATLAPRPEKLSYPTRNIKMMHYGKNVELFINAIVNSDIQDKKLRSDLIHSLVQYMRAKSFEANQDFPNDDIIANSILELSNGAIDLGEDYIGSIRNEHRQNQQAQNRRSGGRGGRGGRGRQNRGRR